VNLSSQNPVSDMGLGLGILLLCLSQHSNMLWQHHFYVHCYAPLYILIEISDTLKKRSMSTKEESR